MAEIRLQFVCEAAFTSRLIAWFSAGQYSHVDCVLDDGSLLGARNDSAGGEPPGVRIRPANYNPFAVRDVMAIPCADAQKADFIGFLKDQVGKPYDRLAIAAFLVNRNWREDDSWICSELQSRAGEIAKIFKRHLLLAANKITPVACALAYSAVGGTLVN